MWKSSLLAVALACSCVAVSSDYECEDPNSQPGCGLNCNKTCDDLYEKIACVKIACPRNGCDCKDGYYYSNASRSCVTEDQCLWDAFKTYTCEDPNAEPGCGYNCNKHCSNIDMKEICPRISCKPNGCDCKNGYYYSPQTKNCVTAEQCPSEASETPTSTDLEEEIEEKA